MRVEKLRQEGDEEDDALEVNNPPFLSIEGALELLAGRLHFLLFMVARVVQDREATVDLLQENEAHQLV